MSRIGEEKLHSRRGLSHRDASSRRLEVYRAEGAFRCARDGTRLRGKACRGGTGRVNPAATAGARWVYDLLIHADKIAVEFDAPYHDGDQQFVIDSKKDAHAKSCGWLVRRIPTLPASVIPSSVLDAVLLDCHAHRAGGSVGVGPTGFDVGKR